MTTYYVNATGGNDGAAGTSEGAAWKTIAKVNAAALVAGDSVLFKRGERWSGTQLVISWSGSLGSPITFASYGSGARPILSGNDLVNCIAANTKSFLVFEDLDCADALDSGFTLGACHDIQILNCDAHDGGNDQLIFYSSCYNCLVDGGRFYDGYQRTVGTVASGIEIADGCHDITLRDVACHDIDGLVFGSGAGITIHSHVGTVLPYNIRVEGAKLYGNRSFGIQILKQDAPDQGNRNIEITNCEMYENAEGIRIVKAAGTANYPTDITLDGCHSHDNTSRACYLAGDSLNIRRSVFQGVGYASECVNLKFHNNTLYLPTGAGAYPLYLTNARTDDAEVKNCIIFCLTSDGMTIGVDATVAAAAVDIDYNLYYLAAEAITAARWYWRGTAYGFADWLTNSGQDANSPAPANPLFESVPADDFHLKSGSPAIDAGTDVGLFYSGDAPDCGAYERWASRGATWLHLAGVHEED